VTNIEETVERWTHNYGWCFVFFNPTDGIFTEIDDPQEAYEYYSLKGEQL